MADKADKWKKFKNAMNEKRTGKQGKPSDPRRNKEETVVQRLSANGFDDLNKLPWSDTRVFLHLACDISPQPLHYNLLFVSPRVIWPCFPVLFSFIAFLNFFHLCALSAIPATASDSGLW